MSEFGKWLRSFGLVVSVLAIVAGVTTCLEFYPVIGLVVVGLVVLGVFTAVVRNMLFG